MSEAGKKEILKRASNETSKRKARAARQASASPDAKHDAGTAVEIVGPAKVDATDRIGTEQTDHQGALALVEGHYDDPVRGKMTRVRTEDNKVRVIPENRLQDVNAPKASSSDSKVRVGPLNISQDRWDEIFGKKNKTKDEE